EAALSGRQVTFEILAPFQNAGQRFVQVTYVPDLEHGKARGFFGLIYDLTEAKRREAEVLSLHTDLSRADRLARLGVMTASLAHELSQPLSAVLSNAQAAIRFLSAESSDLCEVGQILEDIVKAGRRAKEVIV